ncbi:MAG: hypothetical protein IJ366_07350 [Clostridia bacterium]|nr:hypothetical protein [Clostridia bacterium]
MNIKMELFAKVITEAIIFKLNYSDIDLEKEIDSKAVTVLEQIQAVLNKTGVSDFDIVEEIVTIFEDNGLDSGSCHDF